MEDAFRFHSAEVLSQLKSHDMSSDTVFAKIVRREIPAQIVYQDEDVTAFRDMNPAAPVHILIVPNQIIPTLNDATPEDDRLLGKLLLTAQKLAKQEGIAESGYRVVMNCNAEGGQSVYHLHLHLLGGRQMKWPSG
jgi:histidine triad (HIT) family protein